MFSTRSLLFGLVFILIPIMLVDCAAVPTPKPTSASPSAVSPTIDPHFATSGGGEPRSAGYWQEWNSCSGGDQAQVAAANGGRAAGWFIMDDLLADPGILLGELPVVSCQQGLALLQGQDLSGRDRSGEAAYVLAAQLLATQLNLAAAAEYCPAVDQAVVSGQLLLISAAFDGSGGELPLAAEDRQLAQFLSEQLAEYNAGRLCR